MNRLIPSLLLAAIAAAASAQTTTNKTAASSPGAKSSSASPSTTTKPGAAASGPAAPWIKLPPGVPVVAHGPVRTVPITVHYEDMKIGAGAVGESGKLWHIKYTGWRAADGVEFDSWDQHPQPIRDKDGKPELGPDNKPKLEPQPMALPQGLGAVIPGFDFGLAGMRIGGRRRIFIPWQLAYGMQAKNGPPGHPGIPAKSDLIFDVELVEVTELPPPRIPPMLPPHPGAPGTAPHPGVSPQPNGAPATPPTPPPSAAPAQPSTPPQTH